MDFLPGTDDPDANQKNFSGFIGKHLLIGVTYLKVNGEVSHQTQMHGIVDRIENYSLIIKKLNGEEFSMPADEKALSPAAPGIYNLRSTGESVENPDFLMTWTVSPPDEDDTST